MVVQAAVGITMAALAIEVKVSNSGYEVDRLISVMVCSGSGSHRNRDPLPWRQDYWSTSGVQRLVHRNNSTLDYFQ
jgi:hypothetical protein